MLTRSIRGVIYLCWAAFLVSAWIVVAGPEEQTSGYVLTVQGTWTSPPASGGAIRVGDAVSANLMLQGHRKGAEPAKLTIALLNGQVREISCSDKPFCSEKVDAIRPEAMSLPGSILAALRTLVSHRESMPVYAMSRGAGDGLRPAVLLLNGKKLDLTPALAIGAGDYRYAFRTLGGAPSRRVEGELSWNPPDMVTARMPELGPGLYELTVSTTDGDVLGAAPVLVTGPDDYAHKSQTFAEGRQIVRAWPPGVDPGAVRTFLTAVLFEMAAH